MKNHYPMDNAIWLSYNQGGANLAHVKTPLNTLKIRPFLERITDLHLNGVTKPQGSNPNLRSKSARKNYRRNTIYLSLIFMITIYEIWTIKPGIKMFAN